MIKVEINVDGNGWTGFEVDHMSIVDGVLHLDDHSFEINDRFCMRMV